jgi:hypothetical protein
MENTSGQCNASAVPSEIKGWNWGAFGLNFIWAIGNRTWVGLLTLVPIFGIVMAVVLGFKGNEWAWKNKRWKSIDHFKSVQKIWSLWGVSLFILFIVFIVSSWGLFYYAFRTGDPITGEHLDSVDWLPSSATDISFYKRDGFGWIKNYTCSIPENDFLKLAAKKGWELEIIENKIFYEKRYPNGGGVTVNYNTDTRRLSVQSNHR